MFLVTDAMAVAGTESTEFCLGGRDIRRMEGRLTLTDGTLAGADCDLPACLRVITARVRLPVEEALAMATSVPAEAAGIGELAGRLSPGRAADFVHLSEDLHLRGTWLRGVEV